MVKDSGDQSVITENVTAEAGSWRDGVGAPAPTLGHRETNHQPRRGCGECRVAGGNGTVPSAKTRNRFAVGNVG